MAYETLSLSVEAGIAHVQLSRGEKFNTMNKAFWPEMVRSSMKSKRIQAPAWWFFRPKASISPPVWT